MKIFGLTGNVIGHKKLLHFGYRSLLILMVGAGFLLHSPVIGKTEQHLKEWVIILHGIAKSASSMEKLEEHLRDRGYKTVNVTYPSTAETIEVLAERYLPNAIDQCRGDGAKKIHFVTHSLGGIIARQYLQTHTLPHGSRMVMLAPPNKGSEVADKLKGLGIYKWSHGPAGQELGTDSESILNRLKPVNIEVGVIAGDTSINPIFSAMIPGPDDGTIAVERTKLKEMKDFIVVSSTHTFIMDNPLVMRQVVHFLEKGKFDHSLEPKK